MTTPARLFIALWPGSAVRADLAAWRDGWRWPRSATPVRTERLHMTLHFIGDVPAERIGELADALKVPWHSFDLRFGRNVLWPHGIAVLEPDSTPGPLIDLQHSLAETWRALSLPVDQRAFKPHVTLARRAGAAAPEIAGPAIQWKVDRYALMRSHPDHYEVVCDYAG
jgi:2'-5' RNA ligase